ncbi:MAG: diaminopimelate epimerase [Christensenellaceae bacterium]|jgi:diaminopimelate epimerase|nr:diaminopimelate epimerase [Christensenellaceae bacterium]
MKFTKMNGAGNDYVFINSDENFIADPNGLSVKLSERHFGIGSDGLVLYGKGEANESDLKMRIFNADGSEGQTCGNALRCLSRLAKDEDFVSKDALFATIKTLSGIRRAEYWGETVRILMGEPKIISETDGFTLVDVGNRHAVRFVKDISERAKAAAKAVSEKYDLNAELVKINSRSDADVYVWERGSGETLACGSGTAAVAYLASKRGLTADTVKLSLPGGTLTARILGNVVSIEGETEYNCRGEFDI